MLRNLRVLPLAFVFGCYGFADPGPAALTLAGQKAGLALGELPLGGPEGLSDLTLGELPCAAEHAVDEHHEAHVLWAVPERKAQLFELRAIGMPSDDGSQGLLGRRPQAAVRQTLTLTPALPVSLLRTDVDFESLAALAPHQLAIGTESRRPHRREDLILLVEHDRQSAKVIQTIAFPYELWSMQAASNEGIEAMCAASGELVAASESVTVAEDGARLAPLGRTRLPHAAWTPYFVELTSDAGRLSAMTCRSNARGDALEVVAIERHYGIGRLIRFFVPLSTTRGKDAAAQKAPMRLKAEVLVDLQTWVRPLPNFEGIVQLPYNDLLLLSDNDTGGAARPAYVLSIPARALSQRLHP